MKTRTRTMALALLLAAAAGSVWANNLQITNVTVIGRDNSTAFVKFDICPPAAGGHLSSYFSAKLHTEGDAG